MFCALQLPKKHNTSSFFATQTVHRCQGNNNRKLHIKSRSCHITDFLKVDLLLKSRPLSPKEIGYFLWLTNPTKVSINSLNTGLCNISLGPWVMVPSQTWSNIPEYPWSRGFHMTLFSVRVQLDIVWSLEVTTEGFRCHRVPRCVMSAVFQ